jgi:hypothetical protein
LNSRAARLTGSCRRPAPHAPVVQLDVRVAHLGVGQAEAFARAALVVQQLAVGRVGQGRVADDQLLRREGAGVGAVVAVALRKKVTWKPSGLPSAS